MESNKHPKHHKLELSDIINSKFHHIHPHKKSPMKMSRNTTSVKTVRFASSPQQMESLNGNAEELSRRLRRMKRRLLLEYVYGENAIDENNRPESSNVDAPTPKEAPKRVQTPRHVNPRLRRVSPLKNSPPRRILRSVRRRDDSSDSSLTVDSFSFSEDESELSSPASQEL